MPAHNAATRLNQAVVSSQGFSATADETSISGAKDCEDRNQNQAAAKAKTYGYEFKNKIGLRHDGRLFVMSESYS